MFVRVTRGRMDPARVEELRGIAEQAVRSGKELPGCRGIQIAVDRSSGRMVAVSTWDSEEQAQAMSRLRGQAEAAGVQFEAPEMFEVIAQG